MAVTTTSLGSNSVRLDVAANDSVATVFAAIVAAAVAHGWTSFDAANYVLRAPNADGLSYKYAQLRAVGSLGFLDVWESWNSSTHVGTNRAYNVNATAYDANKTAFQASYTSAFSIFVFAHARWLIITSSQSSTSGYGWNTNVDLRALTDPAYRPTYGSYWGASCCLEYQRANAEDLASASYPSAFWTHTTYAADDNISVGATSTPIDNTFNSNGMEVKSPFTLGYSPRLKTNGADALAGSAQLFWASQNISQQQARDAAEGFTSTIVSPWNNSNYFFDLAVRSANGYLGKIFGLKVGQTSGSLIAPNTTMSVYTDSNFMLSRSGSAATFIALPAYALKYVWYVPGNYAVWSIAYYPMFYIPL